MAKRPDTVRTYVDSDETERLGLPLGHCIGRLDTTESYVPDDRVDHERYDKLQREITVVDAYSANVDLEMNIRCRVDVVITTLGVEEQYLAEVLELDALSEPPYGTRYWKPSRAKSWSNAS